MDLSKFKEWEIPLRRYGDTLNYLEQYLSIIIKINDSLMFEALWKQLGWMLEFIFYK